jgi:ATP-dependent Clp protease ATP-binding subunit ClpA
MESLKKQFRPEFLNRLDDIIVFDVLSEKTIKDIVRKRLIEVQDRLSQKELHLNVSDKAIAYLAKEGHDPQYGARPLNRVIQNKILNKIASLMVEQELKSGGTVEVELKKNQLIVTTKKDFKKTIKKVKRKKTRQKVAAQ